MRDSHHSRGIPMGMGTKLLKLMRLGTLIIKVFPFDHNFTPKSVFNLVDS